MNLDKQITYNMQQSQKTSERIETKTMINHNKILYLSNTLINNYKLHFM